jgi:hypothetical protein
MHHPVATPGEFFGIRVDIKGFPKQCKIAIILVKDGDFDNVDTKITK